MSVVHRNGFHAYFINWRFLMVRLMISSSLLALGSSAAPIEARASPFNTAFSRRIPAHHSPHNISGRASLSYQKAI